MYAKLKEAYRWPSVQLFAGHEYVKSEFRPVPDDRVDEALTQLELLELVDELAEPVEAETEDTDDQTEDTDEAPPVYSSLTVPELRKLVQEQHLIDPTGMLKAELVAIMVGDED